MAPTGDSLRARNVGMLLAVLAAMAWCVIGSGSAYAIDIEWVTVGDPGNPPDKTGFGGVAYEYQIAKHEITVAQYADFLNAVATRDPHGLWIAGMGEAAKRQERVDRGHRPSLINRSGDAAALRYEVVAGQEDRPMAYVSFLSAMRFANWLHNGAKAGDTERGAYDLSAGGLTGHTQDARVWIATEDEWYKAAYYHPQATGGPRGGYWLYPTCSNDPPASPDGNARDDDRNAANYSLLLAPNPRRNSDTLPVGSFSRATSHYGTYDQGGNVWEWVEGVAFDTQRVIRGGAAAHTAAKMRSVVRMNAQPEKQYPDTGFRLARRAPK